MVQVNGVHLPPHSAFVPQSLFEVQEFALQVEPVHLAPRVVVPQSEAWPHDVGGVHLAPVHSLSGHCASAPHAEVLHLALLQSLLTVQAASPAQVAVEHLEPVHNLLAGQALSPAQVAAVLHLAPLQSLLTGHALSPAQADAAEHFALLHSLLAVHAASPAQVAEVLHLALLQIPLTGQIVSLAQLSVLHLAPLHLPTPQAVSFAQVLVEQVAPVQMPLAVPQFESRLQAPATHFPAVQTPVVPH